VDTAAVSETVSISAAKKPKNNSLAENMDGAKIIYAGLEWKL
jgi:hypothetical protein